MRLGLAQVDYTQIEATVAETVFVLLCCSPCTYKSSFYFGRDWEGAVQPLPLRWDIELGDPNSLFYANPMAIPDPKKLETLRAWGISMLRSDGECILHRTLESLVCPSQQQSLNC